MITLVDKLSSHKRAWMTALAKTFSQSILFAAHVTHTTYDPRSLCSATSSWRDGGSDQGELVAI